MLVTFAPKRFGAKPVCGTDSLRSAKTSSTAQLKNRHYSQQVFDVKIIFQNFAGISYWPRDGHWNIVGFRYRCSEKTVNKWLF
jgi:uncharacterized protein (DUF1684 family)